MQGEDTLIWIRLNPSLPKDERVNLTLSFSSLDNRR